jgi:hypothetical protein
LIPAIPIAIGLFCLGSIFGKWWSDQDQKASASSRFFRPSSNDDLSVNQTEDKREDLRLITLV